MYSTADDKENLIDTTFNWKDEFFSLREIVMAVRKVEDPLDNARLEFEANLMVNCKRVTKYIFSYPKDSLGGRGFHFASWSAIVLSDLDEDESEDFMFELRDLGECIL